VKSCVKWGFLGANPQAKKEISVFFAKEAIIGVERNGGLI